MRLAKFIIADFLGVSQGGFFTPKRELTEQIKALPVFEYRGKLVADSRDVAALIGRKHAHVMRSITIMCQHLNRSKIGSVDFFISTTYKDGKGETRPRYYLTEMGCEMVAHKQTGEAGTVFTAQYVKAFHAMRDFIAERNTAAWQDTRTLGKEIRRIETDAIKALVDYATAQGSRNAARYYQSISRLANRAAGVTERDSARLAELCVLLLAEKAIAQEIREGIEENRPYKEIYQIIKSRITENLIGIAADIAKGD